MPAWFYIFRLRSGSLYTGSSRTLEERVQDHFKGIACKTTRIDPPIALVHHEQFETYREAFQREQQVKKWSRAKKEALIRGDKAALQTLAKRHKR